MYMKARSTNPSQGDMISVAELTQREPKFFNYSKEQAESASDFVHSPVAKQIVELGYLLVPGPPQDQCVLDLRERFPACFNSPKGGWFQDRPFASEEHVAANQFIAIKRYAVRDSLGENWSDGLTYLKSRVERAPLAVDLLHLCVVTRVIRRITLACPNTFRTASETGESGTHVGVFGSQLYGFSLLRVPDSARDPKTGVAAMFIINP